MLDNALPTEDRPTRRPADFYTIVLAELFVQWLLGAMLTLARHGRHRHPAGTILDPRACFSYGSVRNRGRHMVRQVC